MWPYREGWCPIFRAMVLHGHDGAQGVGLWVASGYRLYPEGLRPISMALVLRGRDGAHGMYSG